MENILPLFTQRVNSKLQGLLLLIGQRSSILGLKTYVVGELVRDILLNQVADKNWEIHLTVEGDAVAFAKEMQILKGTLKTHPHLGTAQIYLHNGATIHLASARQDFYALSAPAQGERANLKKDLYKRDFTINTLAFSILPYNFGLFFDFFNGERDIENGIIRILYRLSFYDDPLRILRAIKYSQRFGFNYEEDTYRLMQKAIKLKVIEKVSREKLYRELEFIFLEPEPSKPLLELIKLGLFQLFFPRYQQLDRKIIIWRRIEKIEADLMGKIGYDRISLFYLSILYDLPYEDVSYLLNYMRLTKKRKKSILMIKERYQEVEDKLSGKSSLNDKEACSLLSSLPGEGVLFFMAIDTDNRITNRLLTYIHKLNGKSQWLTGEKQGDYHSMNEFTSL